jgi:hypothetical protein
MTLVLAAALALASGAAARIRVPHGYRAGLYARGLARAQVSCASV